MQTGAPVTAGTREATCPPCGSPSGLLLQPPETASVPTRGCGRRRRSTGCSSAATDTRHLRAPGRWAGSAVSVGKRETVQTQPVTNGLARNKPSTTSAGFHTPGRETEAPGATQMSGTDQTKRRTVGDGQEMQKVVPKASFSTLKKKNKPQLVFHPAGKPSWGGRICRRSRGRGLPARPLGSSHPTEVTDSPAPEPCARGPIGLCKVGTLGVSQALGFE